MIPSRTPVRRPRTFIHRAGELVILNVALWAWLLFGIAHGIAVQVAIWVCGSLVMFGWEYFAKIRHEREFRRAQGLCMQCGYDLQESTMRCPECGAAVPAGHRSRSGIVSDLERVR
jgi:hypothetical protein